MSREYHFVLTLNGSTTAGETCTLMRKGTVQVHRRATRLDIFEKVRADALVDLDRDEGLAFRGEPIVLCFSLGRNRRP